MHVKRLLKRGLALCLAMAVAMPQAFASDALGSDLKGRTVELAPGVSVTDNSLWSATYSDLRTEYYVTYEPGAAASPLIWYGSTISSKSQLASAAAQLEEQGYRVLAGINGGFFNTDGTAVGLVITDGVIRSLDQWNYHMVGIRADGTAFIDSNTIAKTISWAALDGSAINLNLTAINESRKNGGLYLFTEDFGTTTQNTVAGVDVVLEPVAADQQLTMNSTTTYRVVRVTDSTQEGVSQDSFIPTGCLVLSANKNCDASLLDPLRALTPGTQVTLTISGGDSAWSQAVYGLTGLYALVENGQVVSGLEAGRAPRTALGIKADGSMVFYTIDGRQSGYSVGATYSQVAQRLIELGCVQAVALDGGGSTTLGATLPGSDHFTVLSSPSDGNQRAVSNCLFLVTTAQPTGVAAKYYVDTASDVVLAGASTAVTAAAADASGYSVAGSGALSWTSDGGMVDYDQTGGAVFTAGTLAGDFTVNVSDGLASGSAPVKVVDQLSRLDITRKDTGTSVSSLTLSPGDVVDLDAAGVWYNLPVAMEDENVTWTADPTLGTIGSDGLFTAGEENAEGVITASAGGRTVEIRVKVDRGDPFTDIADHWSQPFVTQLYQMGLTTGIQQPDGTYLYQPDGKLSRGELLVFISRMLGVDTAQYESVVLPFADADQIADWALPHVKAMYTLQVFNGVSADGQLYASVDEMVDRQSAMTMLGRILAQQVSYDLSVFADGGQVSDWASTYVQTLVAQGVITGNGGYLMPQSEMTRGEMAKVITLVSQLAHAELTPRGGETVVPEEPVQPGESEQPQASSPTDEPEETTAPNGEEASEATEGTGETERPDAEQPAEIPEG